MRLLSNKHIGSSEDEESDEEMIENESSDESEESVDEEPEKSEHPFTADSQSNDEDSDEEDKGEHPYPTPPPDAEGNISLGNGLKKITIKESKPKTAKETKINMAGPKKTKPIAEAKKEPAPTPTTVNSPSGSSEPAVMNAAKKGSILANSLSAIGAMNSRSGSSVQAIVKYMKSTGYEVPDTRRMAKNVLRALKIAVAKGEVEQVRRSFKLSPAAKLASKAKQNMMAQKQKKMAKKKQPKTGINPEAEKTEKAKAPPAAGEKVEKPMQRKKKASERSTNEPPKKKANAKLAGAAGKAKEAQAALEEESTKPKSKAKQAKNAVVSPDVTPSGEGAATAKSKAPRKSIGTLAQTTARPKLQTKSIKKLVSGKRNIDEVDSGLMDSMPNEASTPIATVKQKRSGRQMK